MPGLRAVRARLRQLALPAQVRRSTNGTQYRSKLPVKVNGLTIDPTSGKHVAVNILGSGLLRRYEVISGSAVASFPFKDQHIVIQKGALRWTFKDNEIHNAGSLNGRKLNGLEITGAPKNIELPSRGIARTKVFLKLPDQFGAPDVGEADRADRRLAQAGDRLRGGTRRRRRLRVHRPERLDRPDRAQRPEGHLRRRRPVGDRRQRRRSRSSTRRCTPRPGSSTATSTTPAPRSASATPASARSARSSSSASSSASRSTRKQERVRPASRRRDRDLPRRDVHHRLRRPDLRALRRGRPDRRPERARREGDLARRRPRPRHLRRPPVGPARVREDEGRRASRSPTPPSRPTPTAS